MFCQAGTADRWEFHTTSKTLTQKPMGKISSSFGRPPARIHRLDWPKLGCRLTLHYQCDDCFASSPFSTGQPAFHQAFANRHYNTVNTLKILHSAVWHNLGHTDEFLCPEAWLQINWRSLCCIMWWALWWKCVKWKLQEAWWSWASASGNLIIIYLLTRH